MLPIFWPVLAFFFLWLLVLTIFLIRSVWHYQRLTKGIDKKDLKSLLEEILREIKVKDEEIKELAKATSKLEKGVFKPIQKVGFMRYNPFSDTGGDQSFILALLDGKDAGVVFSSFHGREGTRIYAKSIKEGKGENFALSEEEEKVVRQAKTKR